MTGREWGDVFVAASLLAAVRVLLRLFPLPSLLACAARVRPSTRGGVEDAVLVSVRGFDRAARLLPSKCLARALALHCLLRFRGVRTVLRVGVAAAGRELTAHAWLERDGRPIGEPVAPTSVFQTLRGPGREPWVASASS